MDAPTTIDPDGVIKSRGLKLPKDATYLTAKVRGLLNDGSYERDLTDAALKATRDGDRVLDLGCGIGFVAAMLAKQHNITAIHGYDGNARLLTYAEAMLATNGISNVTLSHGVLGARNQTVPFYIRASFAASSLLTGGGRTPEMAEVDMFDANAIVTRVKPDVVICDIEGGEADLLATISLSGVRHLVVKLHPRHIGHDGMRAVFNAANAAGLAYDPGLSAGRIVGFVAP